MSAVAAIKPQTRHALESKWRDLLVDGPQTSVSRSEGTWSFLLHVMQRGWTWDMFYAAMTDQSLRLGEKYRTRKDGRARTDVFKAVRADWDRAVEYIEANPAIVDKTGARFELARIKAHIGHLDCDEIGIPRKVQRSVGEVLEFFWAEAQRRGRIVLSVAVRDIVLGTSVSHRTAIRGIQRLVDAGLISREGERDNVRDAQVYRLHCPGLEQCTECAEGTTSPVRRTGGSTRREVSGAKRALVSAPIQTTRQDAFLQLGRYAAAVYTVLDDKGLRAEEVAELAGVGRRTAFKWLKHLAYLQLAASEAGLWTRTERTLEQAANDLGATGKGEERAEKVKDQREEWEEVADRAQFHHDRARYGHKEAVRRAQERNRAKTVEQPQQPQEELQELADGTVVNLVTGECHTPSQKPPAPALHTLVPPQRTAPPVSPPPARPELTLIKGAIHG